MYLEAPEQMFVHEDKVNNSMRKSFRDIMYYIPALLFPALINVISITMYTRFFSPSVYGTYSLVISTTSILVSVCTQWIQQSVQRFRPGYTEGDMAEFNINYVFLNGCIIFCVGCLGITLTIVSDIFPGIGLSDRWTIIGTLVVLSNFLFLNIAVLFQSDLRSKEFAKYNVWNSILKLTITLGLLIGLSMNMIYVFVGTIISQLLSIIPMISKVRILSDIRRATFSVTSFKSFCRQFIGYGFPMTGWFLATSVMMLGDRYILEIFKGNYQVGIYSANLLIVSTGLGLVTAPVISAAHPVILREASKQDLNPVQFQQIVLKYSKYYISLAIPIAIIVTLFAKQLSEILLNVKYHQGYIVIPIALFGTLIWNFALYGHKGFEVLSKTKLMLVFVGISALVNVILNIFAIPRWGYIGSAVVSSISFSVYPLLVYVFSLKYIRWIIPWGWITRILVISLISAVIPAAISVMVSNPYISVLFGALLYLALFLILFAVVNKVSLVELFGQSLTTIRKRSVKSDIGGQ